MRDLAISILALTACANIALAEESVEPRIQRSIDPSDHRFLVERLYELFVADFARLFGNTPSPTEEDLTITVECSWENQGSRFSEGNLVEWTAALSPYQLIISLRREGGVEEYGDGYGNTSIDGYVDHFDIVADPGSSEGLLESLRTEKGERLGSHNELVDIQHRFGELVGRTILCVEEYFRGTRI